MGIIFKGIRNSWICLSFIESPETGTHVVGGHGEEVFHSRRRTEERNFRFPSAFRMAEAEGE